MNLDESKTIYEYRRLQRMQLRTYRRAMPCKECGQPQKAYTPMRVEDVPSSKPICGLCFARLLKQASAASQQLTLQASFA